MGMGMGMGGGVEIEGGEAAAVGDPHLSKVSGETSDLEPEDLSLSQSAKAKEIEESLHRGLEEAKLTAEEFGMGMGKMGMGKMGMGMGKMGMGKMGMGKMGMGMGMGGPEIE